MTACIQSDDIINRIYFYFQQVDRWKKIAWPSTNPKYKILIQAEYLLLSTGGSLYAKTDIDWFEGLTGKTTKR